MGALAKSDYEERRVYWVWVEGIAKAIVVRVTVSKLFLPDPKMEPFISQQVGYIAMDWLHTQAKVMRELRVERVQRMPDEKGDD